MKRVIDLSDVEHDEDRCARCDNVVGPIEDYCNSCREIIELKQEIEYLEKMVKNVYKVMEDMLGYRDPDFHIISK